MRTAAWVAYTFHMDPVDSLRGDELDVLLRIACAEVIGRAHRKGSGEVPDDD